MAPKRRAVATPRERRPSQRTRQRQGQRQRSSVAGTSPTASSSPQTAQGDSRGTIDVRPSNSSIITFPDWGADEHERFLWALEKYARHPDTSAGVAWHAIADSVRTRSVRDVQIHAHWYYLQLQHRNAQQYRQQLDAQWSVHEDAELEALLAQQDPPTEQSIHVRYPWSTLAAQMQNRKTPDQLRARYQVLCDDVARIEAGQHVSMQLSSRKSPLVSTDDAVIDNEFHGGGISVSLTSRETHLLLTALEYVPVPAQAQEDVLAAVASAVATLACSQQSATSSTTMPPLFSMDDATQALQHAIHLEIRDPRRVMAVLVNDLHLTGYVSGVASPTQRLHQHQTYQPQARLRVSTVQLSPSQTNHTLLESAVHIDGDPVATAGLAFNLSPTTSNLDHDHRYQETLWSSSAAPSSLTPSGGLSASSAPYYSLTSPLSGWGKEDTRSAEELLNLRLSPVGAGPYGHSNRVTLGLEQGASGPFAFTLPPTPPRNASPHLGHVHGLTDHRRAIPADSQGSSEESTPARNEMEVSSSDTLPMADARDNGPDRSNDEDADKNRAQAFPDRRLVPDAMNNYCL